MSIYRRKKSCSLCSVIHEYYHKQLKTADLGWHCLLCNKTPLRWWHHICWYMYMRYLVKGALSTSWHMQYYRPLFISYKFVKGFLAITFLLLVIYSWNFHDVCQRFFYNQKPNFSLIRQKTNIFPIEPHYRNRPLL